MRLLFRFNIGGELASGNRERAEGLGHARRSIALAQELMKDRACEVLLAVGGTRAAPLLRTCGLPHLPVGDDAGEEATLRRFAPDAVVTDINFLDAERIGRYRRFAPVMNLAARGAAKFHADLTFNNTRVMDEPAPPDLRHSPLWFRGSRFAILPEEFCAFRRAMDPRARPDPRAVCVLMGGVDHFDLTGAVVGALLAEGAPELKLHVVLAALYPHAARLRRTIERARRPVTLHVEPRRLPEIMSRCAFGIFGTGTATEEGLLLGLPSLNLGLSRFHDLRGAELSAQGLIFYLGRVDRLDPARLAAQAARLRDDASLREAMRGRALATYDGRGGQRVADLLRRYLAGEALDAMAGDILPGPASPTEPAGTLLPG